MSETEAQHPKSILWPGMIFVVLGISLFMVSTTVFFAVRAADPGVEPDYYQKSLAWETTAAERRRSAELGWTVAPDRDADGVVSLDIADDQGRPLQIASVSGVVFANTHASERIAAVFNESEPGRYISQIDLPHPGRWTVRARVEARGELFAWEGEVLVGGPPE